MRFVDNHKIPSSLAQIRLFESAELERADDDLRLLQWVQVAGTDNLIEGLRFKNCRWDKKLVSELLTPLHAKDLPGRSRADACARSNAELAEFQLQWSCQDPPHPRGLPL